MNTPVAKLPFQQWLDNVALAGLCSRETLEATYNIASLALDLPGDFVECGVYGGANAAVMARTIMDNEWAMCTDGKKRPPRGTTRRVRLFDSFEGIPAGGQHDEGWTHPPGTSTCSLEACKAHMAEWGIPDEALVWHPGWFEKTVPESKWTTAGIALLRLDADLYESTRICMEYLYPLVSPGGWIIVDDWNLPGCRKAVEEVVMPQPVYFQKQWTIGISLAAARPSRKW